MAPPFFVEAQSLSDITQLASNPPKYPRNPTEKGRQPLTLYLARVPGSRDIILTTLRPQLKNVTAEDVASSLYYLHLNTEDDLRFLEEENAAILEETTFDVAASMQKPLPRKPLPESARSSLDLHPLAKPLSAISNSEAFSGDVAGPRQPPFEAKHSIPRRPLGPRPQQIEPIIGRKSLPGAENTPLRTSLDQPSTPKLSNETPRRHVFGNIAGAERPLYDTFSITIIRRDPSSAAQWNIGTVSGRPTQDDGHDRRGKSSSPSKKPYFDMSIQLTTPGYTNFRNSQLVSSLGDHGTTLGQQATQDAIRASLDVGTAPTNQSFDREIRMEGSSFWARSSMQHRRAGSDSSAKFDTARGRSFSGSSANEHNLSGADSGDSQSKGYVLYSPWGGRCKFSTGSGGRTLRCKHTVQGPSGTADSLATAQAPATVSELRFNLPSSAVFNSAKAEIKKKVKESGLSAKFGHFRQKLSVDKVSPPPTPRPHPTSYAARYPSDSEEAPPLPPRLNHGYSATDSSDEGERPQLPQRPSASPYGADGWADEDDSRLDLSLGQEKAGGGNRGKRAKLGKLIIHDEGFKMLDLIVAANMGIWWSVWESDHQ